MSERAADERRLTTILSVDVCGYTALSERDGAGARAAVRTLTARIEDIAGAHQGRVFHRAGDGFLAEFQSATRGVEAAVALHASLADDPITAGGAPIRLRAGLHTGEVAAEASGDLLGHAVNVASRLQGEAEPGGTLVSAATRALFDGGGEAGIATRKVGDLKLKNLRDPVTAYAVLTDRGLAARLRGLVPQGWARRNRAPLTALGLASLVAVSFLAADGVRRDRALRAEIAEQARAARIEEQAEAVAAALVAEEGRLFDREAVETAAASLLASDDPRKAPAIRALLDGDAGAAARSLRGVYDAQRAATEPERACVETALQVGALASGRDQALAQWAYETAYAAMPDEPYVLHRLADIAVDRGQHDMARAYLDALLATGPPPRYRVAALNQLGHVEAVAGRVAEAERRHRQALVLARTHDLAREQAWSLRNLGALATGRAQEGQAEGRLAEASSYFAQALPLARAIGDTALLSTILSGQSAVALYEDRPGEARRLEEERLALVRSMDDEAALASASLNLAFIAQAQGDAAARDRFARGAWQAVEAGGIDGMRAYLFLAEAGWAASDGDEAGACAILLEGEPWIDADDPSLSSIIGFLPDLPCWPDGSGEPSGIASPL